MEEVINYSIIIPHYDIPDLLIRCLHSIPVRPDVQVIVVDDCSPGADKYLWKYPELSRPYLEFYTTHEDGSAGRARNVGLNHAKGRWLVFADADDFFVDNLESDFLDKYVGEDKDIVYFNVRRVFSGNVSIPSNRSMYIDKLFEQYKLDGNEEKFRISYFSPWGKFFKRQLIVENDIRFDETHYANDMYFTVSAGCKAESVLIVNSPLYIVTERDGSLVSNYGLKDGELAIRANVAFRTQHLLQKYGYDLKPILIDGSLLCMIENSEYGLLFKSFHNLSNYNISKIETLKRLFRVRRKNVFWYITMFVVDKFLKDENSTCRSCI